MNQNLANAYNKWKELLNTRIYSGDDDFQEAGLALEGAYRNWLREAKRECVCPTCGNHIDGVVDILSPGTGVCIL